jgi:hypothetical protein
MKALTAYVSKFKTWENRRSTAWGGTFKPIFKIESIWSDIQTYFMQVDRDDVIDLLVKKKKGEVIIKGWSPYKLEGFHSLHLEKAMRYRFANYDGDGWVNVKKAYSTESTQASDRASICSQMQEAISDWDNN